MSNSTSMRRAEDWALAEMQGYGLVNVRREGFEFGRGWDLIDSDVRMIALATHRTTVGSIRVRRSRPSGKPTKAPRNSGLKSAQQTLPSAPLSREVDDIRSERSSAGVAITGVTTELAMGM